MSGSRWKLDPPVLRLLALVCALVLVDTVFFSALATPDLVPYALLGIVCLVTLAMMARSSMSDKR